MKNFLNLFFAAVLSLFFLLPTSLCSETMALLPTSLIIPQDPAALKTVNVALLVDVPEASIATDGVYEIRNRRNSKIFLKGQGPFEAKIRPQGEGFEINGKIYPANEIFLKVSNGTIRVGTRRYRDQVQILRSSEKTLTVVNRVNLEQYLRGVLPLEVTPSWPTEALKAQAVVSRTFALFKSIEKQNQKFSLHDTVRSQVYGGALFHKETTDQAIEATRGEILIVQGKIFPPYFHANCGGQTARADEVWRVTPNSALKGVACSFCKGTKHWVWAYKIPLKEIEKLMQKHGFPAKGLRDVLFVERDSSGRVSKVRLGYKRSKAELSGVDFRSLLGYDRLRSLKSDVEVKDGEANFYGFGWGHGIGFCQWGAKGQAEAGKTYRQILKFYFPGSEIKKI